MRAGHMGFLKRSLTRHIAEYSKTYLVLGVNQEARLTRTARLDKEGETVHHLISIHMRRAFVIRVTASNVIHRIFRLAVKDHHLGNAGCWHA